MNIDFVLVTYLNNVFDKIKNTMKKTTENKQRRGVYIIYFLFLVITWLQNAHAIVNDYHVKAVNASRYTELVPNILRGIRGPLGSFPYQVSIQETIAAGQNMCGGCVVTRSWAVTTAHCLFHTNVVITSFVVATAFVSFNKKEVSYYKIANCHTHPNFSIQDFQNDIAMVQIEGHFHISRYLKPIGFAIFPPTLDTVCLVTGWGSTDENGSSYPDNLMVTDMSIAENSSCSEIYPRFDPESQLCVVGEKDKDICYLDSGNPLVCDGFLYGLVSYGLQKCSQGDPVIFSSIYFYRNWIINVNNSYPYAKRSANNTSYPGIINTLIILFLILIFFINCK